MPQTSKFIEQVTTDLEAGKKHNKVSVEKLAANFGINNKMVVKELTELAIVNIAKGIARNSNLSVKERYYQLVELYQTQPNLSQRSSMSTLLQQYSTPAPLSFIASQFTLCQELTGSCLYFEPSAGNGLLTVAWPQNQTIVNEISDNRIDNLKAQNFKAVTELDGSKDFTKTNLSKLRFDGMATNPPFGSVDKIVVDGLPIKKLEHYMAINALQLLKKNGKAAIIIGGHLEWDDKGRVKSGANRVFYAWLYRNFNVVDTINVNGKKLYTRMGTGFHVRLILLDGRAEEPAFPPLKSQLPDHLTKTVNSWDELWERASHFFETNQPTKKMKIAKAKAKALMLLQSQNVSLGAPYLPASEACFVLDVSTPDSMAYEIHAKLQLVEKEVGGDFTEYVRKKLKYTTRAELCDALAAEQIDGVALAIYNIEKKSQGLIIGDQTGIGKGRMAAAMVRYAVSNGLTPIFITEKANLFSDIYRDLQDIGFDQVKPFIINTKDSKTNIKIGKKILHTAPEKSTQNAIIKKGTLPAEYDFVMATYSQFNSEQRADKRNFLSKVSSRNAIMILDEAHNAGGMSQTGYYFKSVVQSTKGVVFLSATFAKRPDNMPLYAMKTAMRDAAMTDEDLVNAIVKGGVALQEVLAAQLVAEGQMIRRERTYDGIKVNYLTLFNKEKEHSAIADNITAIIQDIIAFEKEYVTPAIDSMDEILKATLQEADKTKGTKNVGVDNSPYFSKVFQVVNQMLFSIKADEVANRAIERLQMGFKPIIAFASTMESFLSEYATEDIIRTDFTEVLKRGLQNTLKYSVKEIEGDSESKFLELSEMPIEAQDAYNRIIDRIKQISSGISISPIDYIQQKIEAAGYRVAEVTGRARRVELDGKGNGQVVPKKKITTNQAFFDFNNNEVDVLMINQSGSTGASAHAHLPKGATITKAEIKPRVMIVLQAELNINTEVQKRGRINRTGQIMKPEYDYITSAIPAEQRLMMMLQKKLKSLDANTTSSQKNSEEIFSSDDFLNKYGDEIVTEYLWEREELNEKLGDPLKFKEVQSKPDNVENAAHKVSGRIAVMSVKEQKMFYDEVKELYEAYVKRLIQKGEYDLEVETMNLQAQSLEKRIVMGGNGGSRFGTHTFMEKCEVNNLKKPFSKDELENIIEANLQGKSPLEIQNNLLNQFADHVERKKAEAIEAVNTRWEKAQKKIVTEKGYKDADKDGAGAQYYSMRVDEMEVAKEKDMEETMRAIDNNAIYLRGLFRDFHIGKSVYYPENIFGEGQTNTPAVFLGFKINEKKPNPFAPSAIGLQFAIAGSAKQIDLLASNKDQPEINAILGASRYIKTAPLSGLGNSYKWRAIAKKRREREQNKSNLVKIYYMDDEVSVLSDFDRSWIDWVKSNMIGRKWNGSMWEWPVRGNENIDFISVLKRFYPDDRIEKYEKGEMTVIRDGAKSEEPAPAIVQEPEPETYTDFLDQWTDLIKGSTIDRTIRYIATGNLLQASGKFEGSRLIQFTRKDGSEDKGILMPVSFNPSKPGQGIPSTVPVDQALKVVKSLQPGSMLNLSNSLTLGKPNYDIWQLTAPSNKRNIYQHPKLMSLSTQGEFFKIGSNFVAKYEEDAVAKVVKILAGEFGVNATLSQVQFSMIEGDLKDHKIEELPQIEIAVKTPEPEAKPDVQKKLKIAKAKAKALLLLQLQTV